jgi:predicted P-loop ATPase
MILKMIKHWLKRAMMWRPEVQESDSKATTSENEKPTTIRKQAVSNEELGKLSAFLHAHYAFRYNALTEQTEMARLDADTLEYVGVGQRELNTICLEVREANLTCWDSDVRRYIESERVEAYHPFIAYFRTLPEWDGVDRVTPLIHRVSDEPVWVNGFRIWLRAATAQYMGKAEIANCLMPILVSAKQGWGKSTFCHNLLPPMLRRYYTETFNLANPGSAEERLANYGEINLDEMDRLSDKKMAVLKNVMQVRTINLRKAYHHHMQSLPRIASFIGTSNRRDLLTDRTGSRRFICVELEHPIYNDSPIEYEQLYAQLKAEVMSGERTWLTKEEEDQVHTHNLPFYRAMLEEEVFYQCFRFANQDEAGSEILTAAQIFEVMQKKNAAALRGLTAYAFSRLLPSMGPRIRTRYNNGYCVIRI